jgi:hypothetical protein
VDFRTCDHLKEDGVLLQFSRTAWPKITSPTPRNHASLGLNSLRLNILPTSPTGSIFCADFRLSPPVFSIFYGQGGRGEGARPL